MTKSRLQILLIFVAIIGIILLLLYFSWSTLFPKPVNLILQQRTSNDVSETLLLDDDTIMGKPDAPVLIVEFGEFMCPYCGQIHREIEQVWRKEYIETGKAKYVFRDYINLGHLRAFTAAEANECADAQGKQWPMYDLLFDNAYTGDAWAQLPNRKDFIEIMNRYAQHLNLDVALFKECINNSTFGEEVQLDASAGSQLGIFGTPVIYIGNDQTGFVKIRGAQPYSVYTQIIDEKLKS